MAMEIVCNFRKCRKSLSNEAWVTTCSHAFCVEHGKREFKRTAENSLTCPACGTELRDKFDVIQADLRPNETFKSIVLAGMRPDTIMDIAMRAMSFWAYQVEQETLYQESVAKHARDKLQCMEEINILKIQKLKAELENCKRKVSNLQSECNKKSKQAEDFKARLEEKSRKIQKLTFQLDGQKRKDIRNFKGMDSKEKCMDISDLVANRVVSDLVSHRGGDFVFRPAKDLDESQRIDRVCSPATPMFDFRNRNKQSFNSSGHSGTHFQFRPVKT